MSMNKPLEDDGAMGDPVPMDVDVKDGLESQKDDHGKEKIASTFEQNSFNKNGCDNKQEAQNKTISTHPHSSTSTDAEMHVENSGSDVEIDAHNESDRNIRTEKNLSAKKLQKTRKLSIRQKRCESLIKARAVRFQNKSREQQDHRQVQEVDDPVVKVPEEDQIIEVPKVAKQIRGRRQTSQSSEIGDALQPLVFNNMDTRHRREGGNPHLLPPLLATINGSVRVFGFSLTQRNLFKRAVMRFGIPNRTDIVAKWKSEMRSKSDAEIRKYSDMLMENLAEFSSDGKETFRNGVPTDNINRRLILGRIGKMKLVRKKVQEYRLFMGAASMPCSLEPAVDVPITSGPLIGIPNKTDPRPEIFFSISDGIRTEVHHRWEEEDLASRGNEYEVWNRRHDYWLLAGIEEHGFKDHFHEICEDPRFSILNVPFCGEGNVGVDKIAWLKYRFQLLERALIVEAQYRISSYLFAEQILSKGVVSETDVLPLVERISNIDNIAICAALYVDDDEDTSLMTFLQLLQSLPLCTNEGRGMKKEQIYRRLQPNREAENNVLPTPRENGQPLPKNNPFEGIPWLPSPFLE